MDFSMLDCRVQQKLGMLLMGKLDGKSTGIYRINLASWLLAFLILTFFHKSLEEAQSE
jgi:hypothetical protein